MRLIRNSLRTPVGAAVRAFSAALALGIGVACGGGAAAPTPTAATSATPGVAVPAPSPQRPPLASPAPSPSAASSSGSGSGSAATSAPSTADVAGQTTYDVQSGDTLASIAQQQYGDGTQWRRIYDANKDAIGADPDKLKLGMTLKIPPKATPTP